MLIDIRPDEFERNRTGALQVVGFADGCSDGLSDRHNDGKRGRYLLQFSPRKKRLLADKAKRNEKDGKGKCRTI